LAYQIRIGEADIMQDETPEHLTGTEARAGTTAHTARVALIGGLALVILIFVIILFIAG
jgi:CHASE3 domain sensor protein